MPYQGQHEPKELTTPKVNVEKEVAVETVKQTNLSNAPERKTASQPSGKLASANLGIKSILNPPKKSELESEEDLPESNNQYTEEEFKKSWNEYAYQLRTARRDNLYTTLTKSDMTIGSDHTVTLKIKNHQAQELDSEKVKLVRHLRLALKNTSINLVYKIEETETVSILDSKATFDKLAEENTSLEKFRKMFGLDIEF